MRDDGDGAIRDARGRRLLGGRGPALTARQLGTPGRRLGGRGLDHRSNDTRPPPGRMSRRAPSALGCGDARRPAPARAGSPAIDRPAGRRVRATWRWAHRSLPALSGRPLGPVVLLGCRDRHGGGLDVRSADPLDRVAPPRPGLARRIPRNTMCFEVEGARDRSAVPGAERAAGRRMPNGAAIAIILHMRPGVTPSTTAWKPCSSTGRPGTTSVAMGIETIAPFATRWSGRFRAGRSIGCSCTRSSARSPSGRAARARGCSRDRARGVDDAIAVGDSRRREAAREAGQEPASETGLQSRGSGSRIARRAASEIGPVVAS